MSCYDTNSIWISLAAKKSRSILQEEKKNPKTQTLFSSVLNFTLGSTNICQCSFCKTHISPWQDMRSISRTWNINKFPKSCRRTEGNISLCKRPGAKQRADHGSWIVICIEEREWGWGKEKYRGKWQALIEGMWEPTPSCRERWRLVTKAVAKMGHLLGFQLLAASAASREVSNLSSWPRG